MICLANLPFIPFLHNSEDIIFLFLVLARVSGLFLISPLLSNRTVSLSLRMVLSAFIAILITASLYPLYRGNTAQFTLPQGESFTPLVLILSTIKEGFIGYLIGFSFVILFEALLIAGQLSGVMIGFSISEMLDPITGTPQSMIAQLFTLTASLLFIFNDLHHEFFHLLAKSFQVAPLGTYEMRYEMLKDLTMGSAKLFDYGVKMATPSVIILGLVSIGLGFTARVMPEMNIFMVGFPLRLLIGYYSLMISISYLPLMFNQAFREFYNLAERLIFHISP